MRWLWQAKKTLSQTCLDPSVNQTIRAPLSVGSVRSLLALNVTLDSYCRSLLVPTPGPVGHQSGSRTPAQAEAKAPPVPPLKQIPTPILMACPSSWQTILDDAVRPQVPETRHPNETRSCSALCYRPSESATTPRFSCATQNGIETVPACCAGPPWMIRTEWCVAMAMRRQNLTVTV